MEGRHPQLSELSAGAENCTYSGVQGKTEDNEYFRREMSFLLSATSLCASLLELLSHTWFLTPPNPCPICCDTGT